MYLHANVGNGAQCPGPARSSNGKPKSDFVEQGILTNKTTFSRLRKVGRTTPSVESKPQTTSVHLTGKSRVHQKQQCQGTPSTGLGNVGQE